MAGTVDTYCREDRPIYYDPVLIDDPQLIDDINAHNARYDARCR